MPPGFFLLLSAQFLSALADNALLIATIGLLPLVGLPPWWAPLLKFAFTLSFVLLAPLVGPLADAWPKGALMSAMNALKVLGVAALLLGLHPVLAFALVGFGAAAHAPAKFGLVAELVPVQRLVAANGWIEGSVVLAALLGTAFGGALTGAWFVGSAGARAVEAWLVAHGLPAAAPLGAAFVLLLALYLAATLTCAALRRGTIRPTERHLPAVTLLQDFGRAGGILWRDADGRLSLVVTTLLWGVGATLQFAVLRWAGERLGLTLEQAAYLQASVAVGVVAGAAFAGQHVALAAARQLLPAGVVLGVLIAIVTLATSVGIALPLLMLIGLCAGALLVPMNSLLQSSGQRLLGTGRAVAVQGFAENLGVLVMLAVYAALAALPLSVVPLMAGFGVALGLAMAALAWRERRSYSWRKASIGSSRAARRAGK